MTERTKLADLKTGVIPACLYWNEDEVAEWVEKEGLSKYTVCFRTNFINGKKLILMDCSNLPLMGIHDFEDIKKITKGIGGLLGIRQGAKREELLKDPRYAYFEAKIKTGEENDELSYTSFVRQNKKFFK